MELCRVSHRWTVLKIILTGHVGKKNLHALGRQTCHAVGDKRTKALELPDVFSSANAWHPETPLLRRFISPRSLTVNEETHRSVPSGFFQPTCTVPGNADRLEEEEEPTRSLHGSSVGVRYQGEPRWWTAVSCYPISGGWGAPNKVVNENLSGGPSCEQPSHWSL